MNKKEKKKQELINYNQEGVEIPRIEAKWSVKATCKFGQKVWKDKFWFRKPNCICGSLSLVGGSKAFACGYSILISDPFFVF